MRLASLATIAFAVSALLPGPAPAVTCQQAKLKAAGKKTAGKLKCSAKAVKDGAPVSAECLDAVELKFQAAFAKAEAGGGCPVPGDAGDVETAVDQCVASILSALGAGSPPAPPAKCLQAKMKAAGKKTSSKLKCWAKATSEPVSNDCLSKAELKFDAAFAKAELKPGCAQTGDAASVEAAVDGCVDDIVDLLPPGSGSSTTTTTLATSTSTSTTSTITTSTTTSTTSTTLVCSGSEPPAVSGMTAAHNSVRANASPTPSPPLDPLCWNSTLEATAQAWADGCNYAHNPSLGSLGYGENIYASAYVGSPPPGYNPPIDAVDAWASEAADYDYGTNTCSSVCGHYTQIVWRDTQFVGCATTFCTTNSPFGPSFPDWTFVVCDYNPPGNFIGQQPY